MKSETFYLHTSLVPIYVIYVPMLIFLVINLVYLPVLCLCTRCVCTRCAYQNMPGVLVKGLGMILTFLGRLFFTPPSGLLLNSEQGNKVYINNKVVPRKVLFILGCYVCLYIYFAFNVFWNLAILEITYGKCDDNVLDCYATTDNESSIPVTDCSEYSNVDNVDIVCYQFVWKFGDGIGAVGGMLTISKILMILASKVFIWCYSLEGKKSKILALLHIYGALFSAILGIIIIAVVPARLPKYLHEGIKYEFIGVSVLVVAAFFVTTFIPWYYFRNTDEAVERIDDNDDKECMYA